MSDERVVTRADVVATAREWMNTPYMHQHRAKGHAVDCAGLVIGVARELGLVAPDFDVTGYGRVPDGKSLIALADEFMDRVPLSRMQAGNVLVLKFQNDPQHVGILGDYIHDAKLLTLIHSYGRVDGRGHVEERRLDPSMRVMRPVQAYALRGVV